MAPFTIDDNLVFLYNCLQHSGKVDLKALAIATGTTEGAARIRLKRIGDRIEVATNTGATTAQPAMATGPSPTQAAKPISQQPKTKKKAGQAKQSRKRKADALDSIKDEVKDESSDSQDPQGPAQLDGQTDEKPTPVGRQLRGKKLNFDVAALFDSDESASDSFLDSDDDYVFGAKSEADSDLRSESKPALKPVPKRLKAVANQVTIRPVTPTLPFRKSVQGGKPNVKKAVLRVASNIGREGVSTKPPVVLKLKAKSTMYPSDQPLPSIEFSPPPTPALVSHVQKQAITDLDHDLDLKDFRPGTLISFPKPPSKRSSVSSVVEGSDVSTSADMKTAVNASTRDREILPEDSISNVTPRGQNSRVMEAGRPTQAGIFASTFQYFKGLLTP